VSFLVHWVVTTVAVLIVSLIPGLLKVDLTHAAIFALVLGLVNAILRPILGFLTLPLTILTLGLFSLVLNLFLFWLAANVSGVNIEGGLVGIIIASLAVTIVSGVIGKLV
jgi:putative membrane protein